MGGNKSARTVPQVLVGHVSNDTAQIPLPNTTNILHKETTYEEAAQCHQKKSFVRFGKFFEICNQSGEVRGNGDSRVVTEVVTGYLCNDTAHIPFQKGMNILHKQTKYEEDGHYGRRP